MSGILHLLFGLIIGLVFLKMAGRGQEKTGWTLTLFFVFVVNNYVGPDFRGFVKRVIAIPLHAETLYLFSEAIHSYVGWILWALLWTPLWYGVLLLMEKKRVMHSQSKEGRNQETQNVSYLHVFLAVLIGGIFHLFIDTIGHVEDVGGTYEFLGQIELLTPLGVDVILCYSIIAAAIVGGILLWRARGRRSPKIAAKTTLKTIFYSQQTKRIAIFVGITIGNVLLLFGVVAMGGLITIVSDTFPWNGYSYEVIVFDIVNALFATKFYTEEAGTWYTVMVICAFLVLFVFAYSRGWTMTIRGRLIKAEYVIIVAAIGAILTGYLLQPVIGNISNAEADFGGFAFLWAFLGFPLVTAAAIGRTTEEG